MGKPFKSKKKEPSERTRAARRAVPLTSNKPPPHVTEGLDSSSSRAVAPSVKFSSNAGISKRKKKSELSRAQKLRAQKAQERADVVASQLEIRAKYSEGKSKVVQWRAKQWETINSMKILSFSLLEDFLEKNVGDHTLSSKENLFTRIADLPTETEAQDETEPLPKILSTTLPLRTLRPIEFSTPVLSIQGA